ncbi:histidine--tRNA ligase, chloroplastic/mitochondrial-like isoform X1 [Phoenix dactylifera]|uniref:histidine--tRNA ligase n=1 Tax=Phoenix dactylifera TaxID=42345 RepID=A0A8B8ZHE8_PHODC|nr:histidine--tRNA ligase, chloroplastic/mitochondrial-like isoform X1 [Phoenix dactylifera]
MRSQSHPRRSREQKCRLSTSIPRGVRGISLRRTCGSVTGSSRTFERCLGFSRSRRSTSRFLSQRLYLSGRLVRKSRSNGIDKKAWLKNHCWGVFRTLKNCILELAYFFLVTLFHVFCLMVMVVHEKVCSKSFIRIKWVTHYSFYCQLYNFEDKGGRRVVLRPEITPSLARLVIKQGKSVSFPLRWFAIGQCWRYERMTRGRRREHYQWNMDIIGVSKVRAEAELIHAIVLLFERLGVTSLDVGIRVSSRKVLQAVLQMYSIPEHLFMEVCVIVDKLGKITREEVEKELMIAGVSLEAVKGIVEVLSLKSLSKLEEVLGSDGEAVADLKRLFSLAEHYGYSKWINFDASVVRGLAYYTGIVFEAFDREGKLRAICGGGRYDRLLSTFGSDDIPACGFGFGDAVIMELLKEKGLVPDLARQVEDIVFPLDVELEGPASKVVSSLRRKGRSVDLIEDKRLKWVFKHAERINASRLVLVGNSEWQRGMVRVKNLSTREEYEIKIDELC